MEIEEIINNLRKDADAANVVGRSIPVCTSDLMREAADVIEHQEAHLADLMQRYVERSGEKTEALRRWADLKERVYERLRRTNANTICHCCFADIMNMMEEMENSNA